MKKVKKEQENKNIVIAVLFIIILVISGIVVFTKFLDKTINSVDRLIGSYAYLETVTNEGNIEQKLIVKATFNKDFTATYEISNGYSVEMTKGTFTFEDGKITYIKEKYNMPEDNSEYTDTVGKIVEFEVYKKTKLQQLEKYYEQDVILERVD